VYAPNHARYSNKQTAGYHKGHGSFPSPVNDKKQKQNTCNRFDHDRQCEVNAGGGFIDILNSLQDEKKQEEVRLVIEYSLKRSGQKCQDNECE